MDTISLGFIEWHVGKFITRDISWILCVNKPSDLKDFDIRNVHVVVIDNCDINVQVHVRREILRLHNHSNNSDTDNDKDNPAIIILKDSALARKTLATNHSSWKNQYDIHSEDDIILTRGFDSPEKINSMLVAMNLPTDIGVGAGIEEDGNKNNSNNNNSIDDLKIHIRKQESQWRNQIAANSAAESTPTGQVKEASVENGQKKKNSFFLNMLG